METIIKVNVRTTLQLEYDLGMEGDKQIKRKKSYAGIKENAGEDKLFEVAETLAMLQTNPLSSVYVNETNMLKEN